MKMTGYTKLFGSIITSTIWREKNETRILWITMLALKNKNGIVEGSVPGIADMARLSIADTEEALETLRSPDPYSRTKDHEGRRIEDVEGGWRVLNHEKWRQKMNEDERREYLRVKQAEHRAKRVNKRKQESTPSTHTNAYTDSDVIRIYEAYPRRIAKPAALKAIEKALAHHEPHWLFGRVVMYAEAIKGTPQEFIPYPQKWFNQERYNDDPATWKTSSNGTHQRPNLQSRSVGTANEGRSSDYGGVGKVA